MTDRPRPRRGPPPGKVASPAATRGTATQRNGYSGTSSKTHRTALAVAATTVAQLDALAALGADAEIHGVVVPQVTWIAAVDGIAQRQRAALRVMDLREPEVS